MANVDIVEELLSARKPSGPPRGGSPDIVEDLLSGKKYEPYGGGERVGGTYSPTGETSTITGKPVTKFVPPRMPEASSWAMGEAGQVDDPFIKMKIFAKNRGIDIARYRLNPQSKQVEFKDDEGNWQREVSELIESRMLNTAASQATDLRNYTTAAGTLIGGPLVGGPIGMVVGSVGRKLIASKVYGEKRDFLNDLVDVGVDTSLAVVTGGAAKSLEWGVNKFLFKGAGAFAKVPELVEAGQKSAGVAQLLSLQDQARAAQIQNMADQLGMKLRPDQLLNKQSLTDLWMYLRHSPATADAVQALDKEFIGANEQALGDFIKRMGGKEMTSSELGEKVVKTGEKIIGKAEATRTKRVGPLYEKAARQAEAAGGVELQPAIDKLDALIDQYPDVPAKNALMKVKKSLTMEALVTEPPVMEEPAVSHVVKKVATPKENDPSSTQFDIRRWLSEHGKIATARNIKTGRMESPGIDMQALTKREGAAGVNKTWPFAKADSGKGETFDVLFQELKANGFTGDIDDALGMLERQLTKGPKSKSEAELYKFFEEIEGPLGSAPGGPPVEGGPSRIPQRELTKIQRAVWALNDLIEGTSKEAADISPSAKADLNRSLSIIKSDILKSMTDVAPTFAKANKMYEKLSGPVDRLKASVVGQVTRLRSDKSISDATAKIFSTANMPDETLLAEAKKVFDKQDPELWRKMVGGYIRDVYENLSVTQQGEVANPMGKMYQALFGSESKRKIMEAAFKGLPEGGSLKELMVVMQRASIGYGAQSMTRPFQEIDRMLTSGNLKINIAKLATQPSSTLHSWTVDKWTRALTAEDQRAMFNALKSPEAIAQIAKLRRLTPGSRKLIEGLAVLTATSLRKYEEGTP
jgi:hypothetical protein